MIAWYWIVISVIFAILITAAFRRGYNIEPVGALYVDMTEENPHIGTYASFNQEPRTFTDGQKIVLTVIFVKPEVKGIRNKNKYQNENLI